MARVLMCSARTFEKEPSAAAEDLVAQLEGPEPKLVTLFASPDRDHEALNRALRERLPKRARLIGATTAGELDNRGFHQGAAILGALSGDLEVGLGLGKGLTADPIEAGAAAIDRACDELGTRPENLDPRRTVGLMIDDGLRYRKEEMMLGALEKNQALVVVGGGATDPGRDPAERAALIHVDGEVVTDVVLMALIETDAAWGALRSHWYLPTGQKLRITRIDETHTHAVEIDGQPAAQRYADLLGVGIDELEYGKPRGFSVRPTALEVGREYFMRAAWKPLPDGSILFPNLLEEGAELEIMKLGDMAGMTRDFFTHEVPRRVPHPTAALLFHCEARMWFAKSTGTVEQLGDTLRYAPPAAGMNVNFEIYSGFQINTTLTTLVFGERAI